MIIALDEMLKARGAKFRVPVLAAAVGIYLPLELTVPIFLGGLLAWFASASSRRTAEDEPEGPERMGRGMLFAAGLITGEALMGIVIAIPIVRRRPRRRARAAGGVSHRPDSRR